MSRSNNIEQKLVLFFALIVSAFEASAQDHSVARVWVEASLHGVRNDFARPTIHARNLFHVSVAMYDTWALYDDRAQPYLIGNQIGGFESHMNLSNLPSEESREEILSHAVYRLLTFRFAKSPNQAITQSYFDSLMVHFNYSTVNTSIDYTDRTASSLGNYIASEIIRFGLMDGSNEQGEYENLYYEPVNEPLLLTEDIPIALSDPDRWQPLTFDTFVDQSGNLLPGSTPGFLSPEWGNVVPFAMGIEDKSVHVRDDQTYQVFHDPSDPPKLKNDADVEAYLWGFSLVAEWGAHLDTEDDVMWDISPATTGNVTDYPTSLEEYRSFYLPEGGTSQQGHTINPVTNLPYESQIVPRGDYARVLAEFWADGPDSETPPGHWFAITNYVMDHPLFEPNLFGSELVNDQLEYDVKTYFVLGGTMHDAAVASWSIKGFYDYLRPISAIRYTSALGQSTDETKANYHPHGIPLQEGKIEVVEEGDPLITDPSDIGEIKLYTWRGHDFINDTETDVAGVGWILAEDWWPYQRPTFVTPPFAGYISGHSTYSSAAAEVLTVLTGSMYFPGGVGEFHAPKDEFLVFEDGPSTDITLQWATYKDAADQCSLSRIWGGIHPPVDDIPGRKIGPQVAQDAIELAKTYFAGQALLSNEFNQITGVSIYPNPIKSGADLNINSNGQLFNKYEIYDMRGVLLSNGSITNQHTNMTVNLLKGIYYLRVIGDSSIQAFRIAVE